MYMNPLKTHKPWLKHFVVGCWAFPSTCQAFKRSLFIWIAINAIKNQFIQWWNPRDLEVLDSYFIAVFRIELESNFEVRIGRSKDFFRIEKLDLIWKSKFEWFERFRGSVRVWTISKKIRKFRYRAFGLICVSFISLFRIWCQKSHKTYLKPQYDRKNWVRLAYATKKTRRWVLIDRSLWSYNDTWLKNLLTTPESNQVKFQIFDFLCYTP